MPQDNKETGLEERIKQEDKPENPANNQNDQENRVFDAAKAIASDIKDTSIDFLTSAAIDLMNPLSIEDFYYYVGEKLHSLNPHSYVIVSGVDMIDKKTITKAVFGELRLLNQVYSLLGYNPLGKEYCFDGYERFKELNNGGIVEVIDGITELTFGKTPRPVARAIEKILNIDEICCIGVLDNEAIAANAAIIVPKGRNLENKDLVNAFIKIASIAYKNSKAETEKRKAIAALEKSEAEYKRLTQSITDVLFTMDLGFNITYVSPSVEKVLGFPVEVYMKRQLKEKYPSDTIIMLQSLFLEEMEREKDPFVDKNRTRIVEFEEYKADGSTTYISAHLSFIRDKNTMPIGIHGVSRDITRQKQAEQALKQSEERLISILDSLEESVYVSDMGTYEVLWVNKTLKDTIGSNPYGKKCYKALQGKNRPCDFCTNEIIKTNNEPYYWQHFNPLIGKTYRIMDRTIMWSGRIARLEVATDITELLRKQNYQEATISVAKILGGLK